MLGFILSKLNLLILVTAIFAIVGFFSFGLTDIIKVNEAAELATRLNEKSFSLASSPSYCSSGSYLLPDSLMVAGKEFYYVVKVSKEKVESYSGEEVNILIFSVYPRLEITRYFGDSSYEPKAIAANSFRTKAEIFLYSQDYFGSGYENAVSLQVSPDGDNEIFLDPQAVLPANTIEMVKEVEAGLPLLHIIGCNYATCKANKETIGEEVHAPNPPVDEGGFRC